MKKIVLVVFCFFIFSTKGFCDDGLALEKENHLLREKVSLLKKQVSQQEKRISRLEKMVLKNDSSIASSNAQSVSDENVLNGLAINVSQTTVFQATDNANGDSLSKNSEDVNDASYSVDIEFEKEFDSQSKAYVHLETGDGAGVDDELKLFSSVNADADDSDNSLAVTEAYYEYSMTDFPATFTFGKLSSSNYIDTNNYANDECGQFLSSVFKNSASISFPDNSAGLHANVSSSDYYELDFLISDANADFEDASDGIFAAMQFNIKPQFLQREGNYRIIAWRDDREYTKWNNQTKTKEESFGFGLSFDQQVSDCLGLFARFGYTDEDVFLNGSDFSLSYDLSFGFQVLGSLWDRENDVFGLGFALIEPSDEYKKASSVKADSEKHLEAYYNFYVNDHFSITPDVSVVWDPYGNDAVNGDKTVFIAGLRTQIDF